MTGAWRETPAAERRRKHCWTLKRLQTQVRRFVLMCLCADAFAHFLSCRILVFSLSLLLLLLLLLLLILLLSRPLSRRRSASSLSASTRVSSAAAFAFATRCFDSGEQEEEKYIWENTVSSQSRSPTLPPISAPTLWHRQRLQSPAAPPHHRRCPPSAHWSPAVAPIAPHSHSNQQCATSADQC